MADVNLTDVPVPVTEQQSGVQTVIQAENQTGKTDTDSSAMAPRKKKKVGRKAALKFEDLPEGWIKEETIRINDPTRKDPLYIDLESGIQFRSLSDVKKYLKNGHLSGCFSRPKFMEKGKLDTLKERNSASGSGSKPIEQNQASESAPKPIRKKRSTRNRLTLTKRKPTTNPLKRAAKKPGSSEPCHTKGRTVSPRPKRKRKVWGSPVRSSPRLARERTPLTTFDKEPGLTPTRLERERTPLTIFDKEPGLTPPHLARERTPLTTFDKEPVLTPIADVAKDEDRNDDVMTPVADVAVDDVMTPVADVAVDDVSMIEAETEPELRSELLNGYETETGQKKEVVLESENLLTSVEDLPGSKPGLGDKIYVQNMPAGKPGVGNEISVQNILGGGPGLGNEISVENMPGGGPGLGDEISVENMIGGGPGLGEELLAGGGLGLEEELLPGDEPISEYFGEFWRDSLNFTFTTLTGTDEFVIPIESDIVGPSNGNINNNNNDNSNNNPNNNNNNNEEEGGNDNGGGNEGAKEEGKDNNGAAK